MQMINRNWAAAAGLLWAGGACAHAGTLLAASNYEEFRSLSTDRFYVAQTDGATILNSRIVNTDYPVGALAEIAGANVLAGSALSRTIRTIDLDGNVLDSVVSDLPANCCNADFAVDPTDNSVWRARYSRGIYELDAETGDIISFDEIADVVGMTFVGDDIWITRWSTGQIGTWDPATNLFSEVFTLPTRVGGLAWDPESETLWVGRRFGFVEPFDLAGNSRGDAIQPFGAIDETIDGLAFIVPEPATIVLLLAGSALMLARRS